MRGGWCIVHLFLTANDRSIITTDLRRISKIVFTSVYKFANLVRVLVDQVEASHSAFAKAEKEVEQQKRLFRSPRSSPIM